MAISANGIIARKNGEEDFLSEKNWDEFRKVATECGSFAIGRKTYEAVMKAGDFDFGSLDLKRMIISKNPDFQAEGFKVAASPQEAIRKLSEAGMDGLMLSGGATVNSAFAKENLIDEMVLIVESVMIGEGIPLFNPDSFDLKLERLSMEELDGGRVKMRYKVIK